MKRFLPWILSLLCVACASNEPHPAELEPVPPPLVEFKADEVLASFDRLSAEKGFPASTRAELRAKLAQTLQTDEYRSLLISPGVMAVGVFDSASKGFLVKGVEGRGLLQLGPQGRPRAFKLSGSTVGLVAGSSGSQGVFLVEGLLRADELSDTYTLAVSTATSSETTLEGTAEPETPARPHTLRLYGLMEGFNLELGRASFALEVEPAPSE